MHRSNQSSRRNRLRKRLRNTLLAVVGVVASTAGCHRAYYREQADHEAYCIIDEKVRHAGERPPSLRIDLDRRSRMFNPFDKDRPPMPVDDPKSHRYMHCVDGRRGYPLWHANGQTNAAESPDWWQFLPLNEDGVLVLNSDTAVQLALLHSTDYQSQLETLYLAALDVSSERFQFDTQFFGGAQSSITGQGEDVSGTTPRTLLRLGPNSNAPGGDIVMQRAFTTGADLAVNLANQITWNLAGSPAETATSALSFSLFQPLLRAAGRDRVMETLTLSERRLLANVRAFERYRRSFYLNITTGRGTESGVRRSGGVFGVGLGGFTGLGGGFSGLSGGGGGGFGGGGFVAQAGGFLGLLQDQLQIRNQEENVARLRENLLLLEDTLRLQLTTIPEDQEEIPRQRLQIAQARSALFSANSGLLQSRTAFESSVDSFLQDLGLPPYICVEIDDPLLDQFELITVELKQRRADITDLRNAVGDINTAMLNLSTESVNPQTGLPERRITPGPELSQQLEALRTQVAPMQLLRERLLLQDLPAITQDIEKLKDSLPEREVQASRLREVYEAEKDQICSLLPISTIDPELFDLSDANELVTKLSDEHAKLTELIDGYGERISQLDQQLAQLIEVVSKPNEENDGSDESQSALTRRILDEAILDSQNLLSDLSDNILTLQLVQARARTEAVVLPEVDLTPREAFDIAMANRRDIANARASLVDSWRLVEFNADNLESSLDLTFNGSVGNTDRSNPLSFADSQGSLSMGLRWDAPITRLQERNTYRQSLIEFQQARRSYYQTEDGIWRLVRAQLRQLRANQINFELQRQAVRIAADQITLNEDIRQLRDSRGLSSGPTAARDIIFALNDLLSAQNSFLDIWVNYEVIRRGLDLDLGTMELTADGMWLDPGTISPQTVGVPRDFGPGIDVSEGMIMEAMPVELADPLREQLAGDEIELAPGEVLVKGSGVRSQPPQPAPLPPEDRQSSMTLRPGVPNSETSADNQSSRRKTPEGVNPLRSATGAPQADADSDASEMTLKGPRVSANRNPFSPKHR